MKLEKKDFPSISEKLLNQMNEMDENELMKKISESVKKKKEKVNKEETE